MLRHRIAIAVLSALALIGVTATPANAASTLGANLTPYVYAQVVQDMGRTVMRLDGDFNGSAYTDAFATFLNNHRNQTLKLCVTARTNNGAGWLEMWTEGGGVGTIFPGVYANYHTHCNTAVYSGTSTRVWFVSKWTGNVPRRDFIYSASINVP